MERPVRKRKGEEQEWELSVGRRALQQSTVAFSNLSARSCIKERTNPEINEARTDLTIYWFATTGFSRRKNRARLKNRSRDLTSPGGAQTEFDSGGEIAPARTPKLLSFGRAFSASRRRGKCECWRGNLREKCYQPTRRAHRKTKGLSFHCISLFLLFYS